MKQLNSLEVAKLAGVSRSTVSRVVNGYSNVPESTRERVMKIIRDNGYYPHLSGQLLAGKKTGTLGFFWISLGDIASDSLSSSYFVNVTEAAAQHGHLILTCILKNLTDCENICWAKKVFTQGRIDGGIFIGVNNNEPVIEELISSGHVVGIFDHFHADRLEPNRISVNFEDDTGSKVIDYLYECGHRKIGIIDGNMNRYSSAKRHESFLKGMQQHSLEIRREWMQYADVTEPAGYEAAKRMLASCSELPTAICANNDAAAFGVYKALTEAGISIPDQVSVTGIDGHGRGELSTPQLTTFAFNYHDFFYSLVSRTIAAIEGKSNNPNTEFMTSQLVERNSVKRLV
ncbi:MAG: LacI family transcriptional regulator [Clostridiales bacterium]|jgi:LacI family transcriptional regulator|nr:LacI family transcriptional regulator [Clostridiales bacterium]MDR2751714.1 LacI family transcriptional regulator [Clostridiales bacterium]